MRRDTIVKMQANSKTASLQTSKNVRQVREIFMYYADSLYRSS